MRSARYTQSLCRKVENLLPHRLNLGHPVIHSRREDGDEVGVPRVRRVTQQPRLVHWMVWVALIAGDAVKIKNNIFTK
jgi:hypothetical protein